MDRVEPARPGSCRLGVVSDTHGRLDEDLLLHLDGVDAILHAGDVGTPGVLEGLRAVAPVFAVRGNVDTGAWARELPLARVVEACGHRLLLGHIRGEVSSGLQGEGRADALIFGHSHKPLEEWRDGVLFLNPGSAGPRRFHLPRAMALLTVTQTALEPRIVILQEGTR